MGLLKTNRHSPDYLPGQYLNTTPGERGAHATNLEALDLVVNHKKLVLIPQQNGLPGGVTLHWYS